MRPTVDTALPSLVHALAIPSATGKEGGSRRKNAISDARRSSVYQSYHYIPISGITQHT